MNTDYFFIGSGLPSFSNFTRKFHMIHKGIDETLVTLCRVLKMFLYLLHLHAQSSVRQECIPRSCTQTMPLLSIVLFVRHSRIIYCRTVRLHQVDEDRQSGFALPCHGYKTRPPQRAVFAVPSNSPFACRIRQSGVACGTRGGAR